MWDMILMKRWHNCNGLKGLRSLHLWLHLRLIPFSPCYLSRLAIILSIEFASGEHGLLQSPRRSFFSPPSEASP